MTEIEATPIVIKDEKKELKLFVFHPLTVTLMMLLDFGGTVLEVPATLAPPLLILFAIIIFGVSFVLTYLLQINLTNDSRESTIKKALVAGIICAIPYPVMSTAVGTLILTLSGYNAISNQGLQGLIEMFKKREN
jgi:hypothetical protein